MGIKQKDENSAGGLHNALAAGTTIKGNIITAVSYTHLTLPTKLEV